MQSAHDAPRCTALSKRTGFLCKPPAVRGWNVCRMHGAGGGAPKKLDPRLKRHQHERVDIRFGECQFSRSPAQFTRAILAVRKD